MNDVGTRLGDSIAQLPDALQEPAMNWAQRMAVAQPGAFDRLAGTQDLDRLLRLIASSEFAGNVVLRQWQAIGDDFCHGMMSKPAKPSELDEILTSSDFSDVDGFKASLRRVRNRHLLRILWRDINATASIEDTLSDLSELADNLIEAARKFAEQRLSERFGILPTDDGCPAPLIVLAMGKLGGHELNFSSDVDLIFLYAEDGETNGKRVLSAHEYFTRMARQVVNLLDDVTEDGFVYRVDTRLRPFGDSGPPVVSFAALESYLLQHGRSWERYAYVKARVVGAASTSTIGDNLMQELISPFVYRRYLDYGVFESLRDMKALISAEGRRRELASNIKLGPGGIREIEFIVQSLQLVRGGNEPNLQSRGLQEVLPRLAMSRGLSASAVAELGSAYRFMRRLENFLQAIRDQQVHEIPASPDDQARVALAMDYSDWQSLEQELKTHRQNVTRHFARVAFRGREDPSDSDRENPFVTLWNTSADKEYWFNVLSNLNYDGAHQMAEALVGFANTGAVRQIDAVSGRRLARLIPALISELEQSTRQATTLRRMLNIISRILRRSAYVALLNENPAVLRRVIKLCENSAYLADEMGRFPALLDEILDPRLFSVTFGADHIRADLEQRLAVRGDLDSEQQVEILAQFQRATLFRVALADFSDELPIMKVSDRLTELAEIVVEHALSIAWRDVTAVHGEPGFTSGGRRQKAGFGVIAYGKLGGMELSYRSDLDLVFLHDSRGSEQHTDGKKPLENSMFFNRVLRRLVHFLTIQTGSGAMYEIDTRLRPSGRSGLLVTNLEGFERYQDENAWTWEHQALLRSRPVAGGAAVAREFERIRSETLRNRVRRDDLLQDVVSMRGKMRKQLDKSDAERFDLKQGRGGIGDIEFLVQYLVLRYAAERPAVIHYTDNIRQLGTLEAAACLNSEAAVGLQQVYKEYRLRLHRLALDERGSLVAADEFAEQRDFVIQVWEDVMAL